jgi:ribosomal protein L17
MADLKPTNEEFSDSSYNNDSRLSQPSSGVRQVRNVQTDKRYDPDKRRGSAVDRAASTFGESRQADKINGQEDQKRTQAEGILSVATAQYQSAGQRAVQTSRSTMSAGGKGLKSVGGKLFGRSVTLGIWSWGFFIWLWFQVPITIVSILFMALTEAIYQLSLSLTVSAEADGLAVTAAKHVLSVTAATINSVAGLVNAVIKEMFGFKEAELTGYHIKKVVPKDKYPETDKLIKKIAPKYVERNGGYTRIIKLPIRKSDASKMALIEFV